MAIALDRARAIDAFEAFAKNPQGIATNRISPSLDIEQSSNGDKDITLTIDQLEKQVHKDPAKAAAAIERFVHGDIGMTGAPGDVEVAAKAELTKALKAAFQVQ